MFVQKYIQEIFIQEISRKERRKNKLPVYDSLFFEYKTICKEEKDSFIGLIDL